MAEDLNFNVKMKSEPLDKTPYLNDSQSFNSGYSSNNSKRDLAGSYQANTPQNDQNQNTEEKFSLFDLKKSSHPIACIFTFIFKLAGILSYLFLGLLTEDSIIIFITVIVAAAADFWTVKNVTGRLLVGLRWWSEIQEGDVEKWHFESHDQKVKLNPIDRTLFWWSQAIACLFWAIISILKIITFSLYWGTCSIICLVLSCVNYWGYYKCSKDHQQKLNSLVQNAALRGFRRGLGF